MFAATGSRLAWAYWGHVGDCYTAEIENAGTVGIYVNAEADAMQRAIEEEANRHAASD